VLHDNDAGELGGILERTSFRASVPPVDAPIAITLLVVSVSAPIGSGFSKFGS